MMDQVALIDTVQIATDSLNSVELIVRISADSLIQTSPFPESESDPGFLFYLQSLREIVIIMATLFGIYIGYRGLVTWWDQLRGKADFELARRIMERTYRLRNAVRQARSIWGFIPDEDLGLPVHERMLKDYSRRWQSVNEVGAELDAAVIEAEALWGATFLDDILPLRKAISNLLVNIEQYLFAIGPEARGTISREKIEKNRKVIYYTGDEADTYNQELEDAISRIEQNVRPHLKKKTYKLFPLNRGKA